MLKSSNLILQQKGEQEWLLTKETQSGGPEQLAKELVDKMLYVFSETTTKVKIVSHIVGINCNELDFQCQIFNLSLFNALLCAADFCTEGKKIYVEIFSGDSASKQKRGHGSNNHQ